jgi:3-oxoacyl-[acyl-carrier-protein] synthase-1
VSNGSPCIAVTGAGMVTPVGHDAVSAAAAIRAGIARFEELEGFVTPQGHHATGSSVRIAKGLSGGARTLALAVPAAQEALFAAQEGGGALGLGSCRLILALRPEERPAYGDFGREELQALLEGAEAEPLLEGAELVRDGHAGGMLALERAGQLLRSGAASCCLVGGVDSLVDDKTLRWLERGRRLKTEIRAEGFIPGEAAAFVALELEDAARARGARPLARLLSSASAQEAASVLSQEPLRGAGLEQAMRAALEGCAARPAEIAGVLCDLNGEYYRMKEWSLASMRLFRDWEEAPGLEHPAECIGDVGAATSPLLVALASTWLSLGFLGEAKLLLFSGSDGGTRGGAVLGPGGAA